MYWGQGTGSVTNCFFIANNATAFGGGMFIDTCVMNIVVSADQAEQAVPFGGALWQQLCRPALLLVLLSCMPAKPLPAGL